ncbi:C4-dicarboxylate TRAP transporter large permease protein DctM [bioreactor metagenome]|uniref:C4-dicarboxylate TRAP transporter large permease protein DctM n=1 Tax=bioreactor metagenome TaxID=1076179 RepID=A0A645JZR2_9ZZZZ
MLIILVIVGCLMDVISATVIFIPVMNPLATSIGLDPIHWGVIFSIMLVIGFITPPVGQVLFVTANASNIEYASLCKNIIPFCIASFIIIIALAYMPDVVMWLPRMFA